MLSHKALCASTSFLIAIPEGWLDVPNKLITEWLLMVAFDGVLAWERRICIGIPMHIRLAALRCFSVIVLSYIIIITI